ncbi:MAG: DUF6677 family protein, partial [Planctomycetota bacterium]
MTDAPPPVELKNRWLAAFLGLVVPGLGHAYQGRKFKAIVFAVSILGIFHWGQALAGWRAVYLDDDPELRRIAQPQRLVRQLVRGYGAQMFNGVVAWPAVVQQRRNADPDNREGRFDGGFDGTAVGQFQFGRDGQLFVAGNYRGRLKLDVDPVLGRPTEGRFEGTDGEGRPVSFEVDEISRVDPPIGASPWRGIWLTVDTDGLDLPETDLGGANGGMFLAEIRRPLSDWYQVPPDRRAKDALHHEFGTGLEIALVFTWVAGFLNVLAVWDAFDGPAYKDAEGRP